jgi:hypothetical protein
MPPEKEMVPGPVRGPDGEELYMTALAAKELGLTQSTMGTLINEGRIKVVWLDARTPLIRRSEVERYRADSLGKPGRKRGRRGGQNERRTG